MLFNSKEKKIKKYLVNRTEDPTAFDSLLMDYVDGSFRSYFEELGMTRIELHIDWSEEYKCIELQGRYKCNYVDIQVQESEQNAEFGIAVDPDEPDIEEDHELESKEFFYSFCRTAIMNAKNE